MSSSYIHVSSNSCYSTKYGIKYEPCTAVCLQLITSAVPQPTGETLKVFADSQVALAAQVWFAAPWLRISSLNHLCLTSQTFSLHCVNLVVPFFCSFLIDSKNLCSFNSATCSFTSGPLNSSTVAKAVCNPIKKGITKVTVSLVRGFIHGHTVSSLVAAVSRPRHLITSNHQSHERQQTVHVVFCLKTGVELAVTMTHAS